MAKIIKIKIGTKTIDFDSDTPDFTELVNAIIENQDFDYEKTLVSCEDDNFDTDTFKDAVINTATSMINELKIDKKAFDETVKVAKEKSKEIEHQS